MRRSDLTWAVVALLVALAPASRCAADDRGDYGVTLAMTGEGARAESLFITMLSHTRGDVTALNNLGNIRLLRGENGVALAFYERALRGDSLDAGIYLNRATALMVIGDTERSQESFAQGVKMAGGVEQAEALLGIPPETQQPTEKSAKKTMIDPEQVRAMLKQAASTVPTTAPKSKTSTAKNDGKQQSAWRSAGPRSADGSETSHLLYWRH